MSAAALTTQLEGLTQKVHLVAEKFDNKNLRLTDAQCIAFDALCVRLSRATSKASEAIHTIRKTYAERESETLSQIQLSREDLIASGQLNNPTIFRRNITLFFTGPKDSNFDSNQTKSRKALTRSRCERIRGLSPERVVLWAAAFAPVAWAAGAMSNDTFDFLVEYNEPEAVQEWPHAILEMLKALAAEGSLAESNEFHDFLRALGEKPVPVMNSTQLKKRKQFESEHAAVQPLHQDHNESRSQFRDQAPEQDPLHKEYMSLSYVNLQNLAQDKEELDAIQAPLLTNQPSQSVLDLKITNLLSFLQQYESSCSNLQMICPLFGVPLPYIKSSWDRPQN